MGALERRGIIKKGREGEREGGREGGLPCPGRLLPWRPPRPAGCSQVEGLARSNDPLGE